MAEKHRITVWREDLERILEFLRNGDVASAINNLEFLTDPIIRENTTALKKKLYWEMQCAKRDGNYERLQFLYEQYSRLKDLI